MEDQTTRFLRKFGTSVGLIREDKALDLKIEKGECPVVLSSPESFPRNWSVAKVSWKNRTFVEILCVNSLLFTNPLCTHT